MLFRLFINQWKESLRSPFWTQSLVQAILLGLIALYFAASLLAVGYLFDTIIEEHFPGKEVILTFNGLMVFYFLADLFVRFFFQRFPALHIRPYLHLPVKKSTLIHYLLLKSIPSYFSCLPLFLILPFFFKIVLPQYSAASAAIWLIFMISMILLNNFIAFYLTKSLGSRPFIALITLLIAGGLFYLEMQGILFLSDYFSAAVLSVIKMPLLISIPFLLILFLYFLVFFLLKNNAYLDVPEGSQSAKQVRSMNLGLANRFGKIGDELELELKLIRRSARARTFVYISLLFLFYPLLLMNDGNSDSIPLRMIIGLILTGAFMLNYAQLLLSWHSPHFDFIITQNISIYDFFLSRYYLLALSNFILLILSLPYLLILPQLGLIILAMFFYNTGIVIYIYMYFSNFNSKRIDPTRGGIMNMEGFGGAHYLIMIPIILGPILVYYFFNLLGFPTGGIWAIVLLGLLGIIFRERIIGMIIGHFKERKHIIAANFRKK